MRTRGSDILFEGIHQFCECLLFLLELANLRRVKCGFVLAELKTLKFDHLRRRELAKSFFFNENVETLRHFNVPASGESFGVARNGTPRPYAFSRERDRRKSVALL